MEFNIPSTLIISLLSFLLFFLMFLKSLTISKSAKAYSYFPGPKPLPLIGNLHLMLRAAAPHRMFRDLAARYGPLMHMQLGETHFLVISSADLAKQVMKTHDVNFANRPPGLVAEAVTFNYSDVAFAPYGDFWRQLKKICTLELLSARRVRSLRHIREEENMNLAKGLASCKGSSANLSERLNFMSYDIITRAVVGGKTSQRAATIPVLRETTKLVAGGGFMIADLYPSIKSLPLITGAQFKIGRMQRKLEGLFDGIIEQHRAAAKNTEHGDSVFEDLVDVLLKLQADGSEVSLTNDNIKGVLVDMFAAGTDTTTTFIEWAMSEMIRNPSKLNKAQEEIRKVFDSKGRHINEENFDELKYLKLIIKETLRLHPPAPLLVPRMNTEKCEINGYEIPAKTRVIVNAWALGRDAKYWNEPEKFEPERFEENSIDYKGNDIEFIPFGAGRRICPGMTLAMANIQSALVMLLYHFDWKMPFGLKNEELDMTDGFVGRKYHLHLIPILKRPLHATAA